MPRKVDIRKTKTKKMLIEGLIELLKRKDLNEIKIKDLTEQAKVSRQSFYRHYKLIDELFHDCVKEVFDIIDNERAEAFARVENKDLQKHLIVVFQIFFKHRETLAVLLNVNERDLIIDNLFKQLENAYANYGTLEYTPPDKSNFQYLYIRCESGLLYVFLKEWLRQKNPVAPEEIAKTYLKIRTTTYFKEKSHSLYYA